MIGFHKLDYTVQRTLVLLTIFMHLSCSSNGNQNEKQDPPPPPEPPPQDSGATAEQTFVQAFGFSEEAIESPECRGGSPVKLKTDSALVFDGNKEDWGESHRVAADKNNALAIDQRLARVSDGLGVLLEGLYEWDKVSIEFYSFTKNKGSNLRLSKLYHGVSR